MEQTENVPANSKCLAGRTNLIKMFLMPQFLYMLHNTPVVITLKIFRVVNNLFRLLLWHTKPPRIKLEQLQYPKEGGGLALPNPWIYYLATQLPHLIGDMAPGPASSSAKLMLIGSGVESIPEGLEAQQFQRPNKQMPTYTLFQKVWNKAKLQNVTVYTAYSPLWGNQTYTNWPKSNRGPGGITHLRHVFHNGTLLSFSDLQSKYALPSNMLFCYLQQRHAVRAQGEAVDWVQSPTPVFHMFHMFHKYINWFVWKLYRYIVT